MQNKLTREEINEVLTVAENARKANPELRQGQAFYNVLYALHTQIALIVDATEYDPFYDDSKLDACIEYLTKQRMMKIEELPSIPGNPFISDLYHIGYKIGKNVTIMHSKFEDEYHEYIIVVDTTTGERIKITFPKGEKE